MPRLEVTAGKQRGHVFDLEDRETIGYATSNSIVLRDRQAPAACVEIVREGTEYVLRALDTERPPLLNGKPAIKARLQHGDQIILGNTQLKYDNAQDLQATDDDGTAGAKRLNLMKSLEEIDALAEACEPRPDPPVSTREETLVLKTLRRLVGAKLECSSLLDMVAGLVVEATGAERCFLVLLDENGDLLFEAARNLADERIQSPEFKVSHSIIKRVASRGCHILLEDAVNSAPFKAFESVGALNIRSVLCVPVKHEKRVIAVVYLDNVGSARLFSQEDLRLVAGFAEEISMPLWNALEHHKRLDELGRLRAALEHSANTIKQKYDFDQIVGESVRLMEVLHTVARVCDTNSTVLLQGESGTGKELVAAALHYNGSKRKAMPFVVVNCAALPEQLLESELFGHVKGAFTGAECTRKGLLEVADQGTVFLDEIGDMSQNLQARLLRFVESGEIRKVGGSSVLKIDARVVAATNKSLPEMVQRGKFRADLFHRLNVLAITLPPLRERKEDIPLLARHLLRKWCVENGRSPLQIADEALEVLMSHPWPGNVRQLKNVLARAASFAKGDTIIIADLPPELSGISVSETSQPIPTPVSGKDLRRLKKVFTSVLEKNFLVRALVKNDGNVTRAAKYVLVNRVQFQKLMRKHGLNLQHFRQTSSGSPGSPVSRSRPAQ